MSATVVFHIPEVAMSVHPHAWAGAQTNNTCPCAQTLPHLHLCCRRISDMLGLVKDKHYVHACMGNNGFAVLIDELEDKPTDSIVRCDIGVSSITENQLRTDQGITFSAATVRESLAIMTFVPDAAPIDGPEGLTSWLKPLHRNVWFVALGAVICLPFLIFFVEVGLSSRCAPLPLMLPCPLEGALVNPWGCALQAPQASLSAMETRGPGGGVWNLIVISYADTRAQHCAALICTALHSPVWNHLNLRHVETT